MQFTKNTSKGGLKGPIKLLIKVLLVILVLFFILKTIDKINLPAPNKTIEKIIPNENFKTLK